MNNQNQWAAYLHMIECDSLPLATGPTREAAIEKAIPRALVMAAGHIHSTIGAQRLPELSCFEFARLGETLDTFAAERLGL